MSEVRIGEKYQDVLSGIVLTVDSFTPKMARCLTPCGERITMPCEFLERQDWYRCVESPAIYPTHEVHA